jgi:hypothetical protein
MEIPWDFSWVSSAPPGKPPNIASVRLRQLPSKSFTNHYTFIILLSTPYNISLSLSLWLYSPLDPGRLFSFLILYTDCRTSWTSDQPVARPLPTHRTAQTQNKGTHRHLCFDWDSNPGPHCSSGFMPYTTRPLTSAAIYIIAADNRVFI